MAAESVSGAWSGDTAGGCPKYDTWKKNPTYTLTPSEPGTFALTVSQRPAEDVGGSALVPIGLVVLLGDAGAPLRKLTADMIVGKSKYKPVPAMTLSVTLEVPAEGEARRLVEDVGVARAAVGDHREPEPQQRVERRLVVGDTDEPAEDGCAGRQWWWWECVT